MRLARLRIAGFKSFADPVSLSIGPGVTAIVGPNGSGKSNVVDAIAWVLGTQSPRFLRLARMEEVIYAGSEERPALGRAEVVIEFDNADGALGLPLAEVAVSREIKRSGEAGYAINRTPARLVDVLELLGAVNLGRTQHVIISQGEVDSLSNARGEELRGMLEDASQVSLLRRRWQQASRDLERVGALLAEEESRERELRRRMRPLEAQARAARERAALEERREQLARWLARERLERLREEAEAQHRALAEVTGAMTRIEERLVILEDAEAVWGPRQSALRALEERRLGLRAELARLGARLAAKEAALGQRVAEWRMLDEERERLQGARTAALGDLRRLEEEGAALAREREALEAALGDLEARRPVRDDSLAQRLEELDHRRGELAVELRRCQEEALAATRRQARRDQASARAAALEEERVALEERASALADALQTLADEAELWAAFRASQERADAAKATLDELVARERLVEGALRGLEAPSEDPDRVAARLVPRRGLEQAVAAVVGDLAEARVYDDLDAMLAALDEVGEGFVGVLGSLDLGEESRTFLERPSDGIRGLFAGFELVDSVPDRLREGIPDHGLVDRRGCSYARGVLRLGGGARVVARARRAQLLEERDALSGPLASARAAFEEAREARVRASSTLEERQRQATQLERELAGLARRRGELDVELATLSARLEEEVPLGSDPAPIEAALAELEHERRSLVASEESWRHALGAHQAREAEVQRQLVGIRVRAGELTASLRDATRRLGEMEHRLSELEERLARPVDDRELTELRSGMEALEALELATDDLGARLRPLIEAAAAKAQEEAATADEIRRLRVEREELQGRRLELATGESRARARLAAEEDAIPRQVGTSVSALADATLPEGVAPTAARALAEELEERLGRLGPVNPLAALELAELEAELGRMREASRDVREARSAAERLRAELEQAIASRTVEVVAAVSEAFDGLMGRLFRGARGKVVLEDPSEPFSSPVALEITIPARKVHRVGLLSGGERSLVSLAFLFAVLTARPVPFVVLDEVEAALDDKNLALFADLLVEMGATTQVIVVTHQRRTMEVASTLIGVSMSPRGSSRVVRHVLGDALEA